MAASFMALLPVIFFCYLRRDILLKEQKCPELKDNKKLEG
jgi:hypothetical protein